MLEDTGAEEAEVQVPCEVYSRIVGYMTPIRLWNKGKAQEFTDRVTFKVTQIVPRSEFSGIASYELGVRSEELGRGDG